MKRLRGYRVGGKVKRVFRWLTRPRRNPNRLTLPARLNPVSRLTNFLRRGARSLGFGNSGPKYIQLGQTKHGGADVEVPKGHLAVYVAESGGDTRRVVVPVIYFNHPLFGELLREAERVYGYDHPGGITIPCGYSEFEKVKTRIAKWDDSKRRRSVAGLS